MDAVGKITLNIVYSIGNSPFSLLTGRTIGGMSLNLEEKIQSFVDVVPGLLSGGLSKSGYVIKISEKGIDGFNKFKNSVGTISTKELPAGMKCQENASQLFKSNKINQQGLKDFNNAMRAIEGPYVIKKENNKER
jgi:hypothetical protein